MGGAWGQEVREVMRSDDSDGGDSGDEVMEVMEVTEVTVRDRPDLRNSPKSYPSLISPTIAMSP